MTQSGGDRITTQPVFIDFSLVGHASTSSARIPARARRNLREGDRIVVFGDAVDPMPAVVLHIAEDDPNVVLELAAS